MNVFGTIYDLATRDVLPGASVTVTDQHGNPTGSGGDADANGFFNVTSTALDMGGKLLFSNVGYKSVLADPATVAGTATMGLQQDPEALSQVTVTAQLPKKNNALLYVAGGGLLLLLMSSGKKKGRMGAVNVDWSKIAITGGVLVGGFFIGKALLQKWGILSSPSAQDIATTAAQTQSLNQAKATAAASGSGGASYTADQYTGWANDIYQQARVTDTTPIPVANQIAIVEDITNANNMVDLQSIISAFGIRQAKCFAFNLGCTNYDLPAFIKLALDADHINNINQYLSAQSINYQF